jgi:hypothetical protein
LRLLLLYLMLLLLLLRWMFVLLLVSVYMLHRLVHTPGYLGYLSENAFSPMEMFYSRA